MYIVAVVYLVFAGIRWYFLVLYGTQWYLHLLGLFGTHLYLSYMKNRTVFREVSSNATFVRCV